MTAEEIRTGDVNWSAWIEGAKDLDAVGRALSRETVIRAVMADSGETREIVADMIDAMKSMGSEAVLDLTEGEPTTLSDALSRYVDVLADRDEIIPRDRVLSDLDAMLSYTWPGLPDAAALAREIHETYVRIAAPGVVTWNDIDPDERELATAVISDLIGRQILAKRV